MIVVTSDRGLAGAYNSNVLKHAGPCEVHLSMVCDADQMDIEIRDTGRGFAPGDSGAENHGLANLSGRLHELGGTCEISSSPDKGTRVCLSAPIPVHQTSATQNP